MPQLGPAERGHFGSPGRGVKAALWDARGGASATRAGTHFATRPDDCATPSATEADARCHPLRLARPTATVARCLSKALQGPARPQPVTTQRTRQRRKRRSKRISFAAWPQHHVTPASPPNCVPLSGCRNAPTKKGRWREPRSPRFGQWLQIQKAGPDPWGQRRLRAEPL